MPINLTEEQIAPARLLALSPHGNPSQSVSSIVTTIPAEGLPLISGLTAAGVPLFQGILFCPEARHTTTIITTTTTTYRMVEVSDSDSMSDDFELVDDSALTVDVPLVTSRTPSPQYMIVGKTESDAPLSPVMKTRMNIDLEFLQSRTEPEPELDERPIMELVSVYHSGISEDADSTQSTAELLKLESPELYTNDEMASTSEQDYGINVRSNSDMKTIGTSSEDEDMVLVESELVQMTTSGSSINDEKTETTKIDSRVGEIRDYDKDAWKSQKDEQYWSLKETQLDYRIVSSHEEPPDTTFRTDDIYGEPLTHHVSVYHSGRSDEPTPKPEAEHIDIADTAKSIGDKISGLFKRRPTVPDYPTSEPYEGPLMDTSRRDDIESQPLQTVVTVYHSGRSDVPHEKAVIVTEEVQPPKDQYYDYPTTAAYEGPLDSTLRTDDIYGEPLTHHVSVYHSGSSDEPEEKPEGEHVDIADAAKAFGEKITGLFKKGPAHLDYPVSETYEGPLDSTQRTDDIYGEPLTHHVSVYHSGRSDEPTPKPEAEHIDIADTAKSIGDKISPLMDTSRRDDIESQPLQTVVTVYHSGRSDVPHEKAVIVTEEVQPTKDQYYDYPTTAAYEGPLDSTLRTDDIYGEPLTHHVSVYHSGRSDEPEEKPEGEHVDIADAAKAFGEKITGLFKKGPAHLDYPVSETYEGPLDSTQRTDDIYGEPLTHHVSVYHSGRSDEPTPKPEAEHIDIADTAKSIGDKISGLFKRRPTVPDYPTSEPYEGPLMDTSRRDDIESQPLQTVVTVYHSGRSDVPHEKAVIVTEEVQPTKDQYYDYPTTAAYEGPLDSTLRTDDIYGEPLTHHVSVYHSGRSDEPEEKPEGEHVDIADAAKAFGEKITGLFKKGPAHLDYPVSETYEGPLDSTQRTDDIYGEPLTHHVSVYHSGRSDEPTPKPEAEHIDIADTAKSIGDKISGLFKRRPTVPDYPTSEPYEGPLMDTSRRDDIESQPLQTVVTVYHSGRSDVPHEKAVIVTEEVQPAKDQYYDYPTTAAYEGPLDSTLRTDDIYGEPLTHHVSVYHSGRSDEPEEKPEGEHVDIADAAKAFGEKITGLFKKGPAHLDYPVSETYEGPLDSTQRTDDIYGEPLTHHVSVYHSGRSDEPEEKPEGEHVDIADAAKAFGEKITGLFKKGPAHLDYPVSETYEGPLDSTQRTDDIYGEPLTHHVSVYHSGRSDEPTPKPEAEHIDIADTAKSIGDKISGLFKRRPTVPDYPTSEPYEGPLMDTSRRDDIESQPLQTVVTVYHSGRSDVPHEKAVIVTEEVQPAKDQYYDYPTTAAYEGPLDSTLRTDDIYGEPLTHHVSVYHSGRSDEPEEKPEGEHVDIADAAKAFGEKITGLFKKGPAHLDYPVSETYEGPLDSTQRTDDIYGEPLTHHVSVYHSGRSDEPTPKPEAEHIDIADTAKSIGDKISGLFKRRPTVPDYPTSEPYEGPLMDTSRRDDIESQPLQTVVTVYHSGRSDVPHEKAVIVTEEVQPPKDQYYDYPTTAAYEGPLDSTLRTDDIYGEPLTHHVSVYHSGRSDEPEEKPEGEHVDIADAAKAFGEKITGLFKKGPAHLDYPVSETYEGPLDSTQRTDDIYGEPLTHHVSVYHSGRSDEPTPKPEAEHIDIADTAKSIGDKISGLFKRRPTVPDYPTSEPYEGPLMDTSRRDDIESQPLQTVVTVYHSGRSDVPHEKAVIVTEEVQPTKDQYYDYPTTAAYEGPLDSTLRTDDIYGEPLTHHVSVYHSGRSDEPEEKPEGEHVDIADAAKAFGEKITGLFKKGPAHLDYPVSETYEGPLDSTQRTDDIYGEPLTHHVSVYHSGRSDEPEEKPEGEHVDIADAAKAFGEKITGLFKKGPAHLDYPVSETYEGPLDSTQRTDDIYGEPLTHHVSVYHSGRSDEPTPKPEAEHIDIADTAKSIGDKISGLFKRRPTVPDYPTSEPYEGPLMDTSRRDDIESQPLQTVVTVYHSGRSDVPHEKAVIVTEEVQPTKDQYYDYPTTAAYEGPLDSTLRTDDIYGEPLTHHVSVYHSGRSDEPEEKPEGEHVDIADAAKAFGEKITGLFKKGPAHLDYPVSETYEGPLDSTQRTDDIYGEPLTHHVSVYHSGRSDEPEEKPEGEHVDIADAAKAFGEKITGLFKKGPAHLDYPVSETYEGPLDSTQRTDDIYGEPLTHHVSVYHSGRSDEPTPKPEAEHIDIADTAKSIGDKISGLFKRRPTVPDYPTSEPYEGPLMDTSRRDDIESQPLQTVVTVYHSGRSDVPHEKAVIVTEEVQPTKDQYYDYPTTAAYEGPLDSTLRTDDIYGEPLTHHVSVYHSGRSDEPEEKPEGEHVDIADAAKAFGEKITGLFKKGPAHLDYPVSETYEGPLDSTQRTDDIYGEPLTHHVSVYHSGRSDEPEEKPEGEHVDIADAAKAFGEKITGLFKKGPAHLDYPVSETYEGPLDSTQRTDDIYGEPLTHHVSVYHSGRSDEPTPKPEAEHIDIADTAKSIGDKISGLFKRRPTVPDYPTSEPYEGPLMDTSRRDDIESQPLQTVVTVYHSGRSDVPHEKAVIVTEEVQPTKDQYYDYPTTAAYEGPLDSTLRTDDIYGEPLTHHVSVYHSGRSDEPEEKPEGEHVDIADAAKAFGEKITGLFKKGPAHLDYPVSETYEGPLDSTQRTDDIYGEPLTHHVSVYHSGRSDEPEEKPEGEHVDIADAAKAFGEKITGLFKKGPAHLDYPVSETYEGPLDSTQRTDDIYGEPLTHHVSVYHSGRSDEPTPKPEAEHIDIADTAKSIGDKISGLFKRRPTVPDYPTSEPYEGPLMDTSRRDDIESQPLQTVVTVYHSGRSDVPHEKAVIVTEEVQPTKDQYYDYPTTAAYEGPLDSTLRTDDIYGEPLTHHVSVYHSGRSDEPEEKPEGEHVDIADAAKAFGEKITGLFKKGPAHLDYPVSETYEGPLDSTQRTDDIYGEPLTHHVSVYHSGRSDEPEEKPEGEHVDIADAAKAFGEKITGLFKKGPAHLDYPVSETYEGPLDSTQRTDDIYGEPLTHHVSVYHSGRSDEPTPKPEAEHIDIADTAKSIGDKISGLFKRRPTVPDYPTSEPYEGPLMDTSRRDDIESQPLQTVVTVYHSGRSDVPHEKAVIVTEEVQPTKDQYYDYPTTAAYEGPLDSTLRTDDIYGEPLTHHVSVYHSGRSDEPEEKPEGEHVDIADAAKAFGEKITGLFKKGPAHLDYPVSETYEGPLDSTQRTDDIYGEPLTHHVSVYHSGRSDEPTPKPEAEHIDIADTAKSIGDKISGLFKRRPTVPDYPTSEPYEGPLMDTSRRDDIESQPLQTVVTVYHSGRSDVPHEKAVIVTEEVQPTKDQYYDYPTTAAYEGPLDSTLRTDDIYGEPLTHHVSVYHSGRSDEPEEKPEGEHVDIADAAKAFGEKITGLFKKGPAHLDYPVSETYEGPLDSTQRTDDIYGEPLTHHVSVYHSGRSDEPTPKPEAEHIDIADTAKSIGDKISGLFKRRPTVPDYPTSEPYEGPLMDTSRRDDIESQPLQTVVTVYHSGRSDVPHEKAVIVTEEVQPTKDQYYDYPTTAAYEGPLDSTLRTDDIYGEPLTHHVSVYHSGRSDEPEEKPEGEHVDIADAAKAFGEKITGLFKKGPAHLDYPVSETYEGPLDSTQRTDDIYGEPLTHHVSVYHSGRSDEPEEKPEGEHVDIADAAKAFGEKITGLFKKGPAHLDYPVSETYEGPLDSTQRTDDIYGEPLTHHVSVYHSGRSDEPTPKPEAEHIDIADTAKSIGDKISGLFKRRPTVPDYPTSEPYEGPLMDTSRRDDIESQPLQTVVTVYHSGRSDVPHEKAVIVTEEVQPTKDQYYDYPTTAAYEGPLDSTLRTDDIYGEPLTHHVSVYHSGRSDEPEEKPEGEHVDIADAAKAFGEKITGLFKKGPAHLDYPVSETYEGPLDSTQRTDDIYGEPLTHHVSVYHSGRSDEPEEKPEGEHVDIADAAKAFGEKITGLFKKGPAHLDYPVSETYEGPLDSTQRTDDIYGEPLTHHVSVYHSGRSDEPTPKPEAEHIDIADTAKSIGDKISGLFKRRPTVPDYPTSEPYEGPLMDTSRRDDIESQPLQTVVTVYHSGRSDVPHEKAVIVTEEVQPTKDQYYDYPTTAAYEGPLDSTLRTDDIYGEPLTHHVSVYHSGRSDEPEEKPEGEHVDIADAAKAFGEKITGLFKKGPAHLDYPVSETYEGPLYPVSETYEGPLDSTQRTDDIYGEPLTHHVSVYHSGRSDEPTPKPEAEHIDIADTAKSIGDKISGLFKRRPTVPDYPTSEPYEGPLMDTSRRDDIESQPLQTVVTVYHSGRSDVPHEKAVIVTEEVQPTKDQYYDYPTTAAYEGPLDSTLRTDDIYGEPLTHHVSVYHSGRSDEPEEKPEGEHVDIADAAKAFGEKITGLFKKGPAHLDYPVSETYEGPLDSTQRTDDIYGEPLTHHVSVYHSGRSDEPEEKPEGEHVDIADAAKAFGEKITGLFKKGPAHLDYPVSETYEGPLDSTQRTDDIYGEPLTHHVSVYHSGRSDEPTPKPEAEHIDIADTAKSIGDKISGLFKRRPTVPDYPTSEPYEGPLMDTSRRDDIESQPLQTVVTVYHSGRSDVPHEKAVIVTEEVQPTKDQYYDYPTTAAYEGPLDSTLRTDDIYGEPLTHHVSVYHSGRSDEPEEKPEGEHVDIADAAKAFGEKITGLFKKGPAHLDYPVSETYEGPLDSTQRTDDIYGEPLTHHVSVYHSGRSDEPTPKPEAEHIDIADTAKSIGDKISGLFKRRPTVPDYPTSEPYEGPLMDTSRRDDIESQPLQTVVTVYHSGRSDVPHEKAVIVTEEVQPTKDQYYDYPTTAAYEGPLDSTLRTDDIYGEPLTHHVSVYHSGRSDEPEEKPEAPFMLS
ncbi:hypothetical protein Q1695_008675 [Nippostrongylus brasiliensis]|nr:hypothetical protein Q1695_008675 [Nippostrongylus brasiliensis]